MGWINVLAYASPLASAGFSPTQVLTALIAEIPTNTSGQAGSSVLSTGDWPWPASLSVSAPSWKPTWSLVALFCLLSTFVAPSRAMGFRHPTSNHRVCLHGILQQHGLVQRRFRIHPLHGPDHVHHVRPRGRHPHVLRDQEPQAHHRPAGPGIFCGHLYRAVLLLCGSPPVRPGTVGRPCRLLARCYRSSAICQRGPARREGLAFATFVILSLNLFSVTHNYSRPAPG